MESVCPAVTHCFPLTQFSGFPLGGLIVVAVSGEAEQIAVVSASVRLANTASLSGGD